MDTLNLFWQQAPNILSIAMIIFFVPFEILSPRIQASKQWKQRVPVIVALGTLSILTGWLLSFFMQEHIVTLLKKIQIMSMAKADLPASIIFLMSFLFIDLLAYIFHRLSHTFRLLWNLHAIHHSDEHVTSITGQLHHPVEMVFAYLFMFSFYVVLGIPLVVVAAYALVSSIHNAFSHPDILVSARIDKILRSIVVTPDMHRTHHSINPIEGNSNFGQLFSFWDRIFDTYTAHPSVAEEKLEMGLPSEIALKPFRTAGLLLYPFKNLFK